MTMKPQPGGNGDKLSCLTAMLQQQLHGLLPVGGDYSLLAGLLKATRRDRLNEAGDSGEGPRVGIVVQGGKCMEDSGRLYHCGEAACFVDARGRCGLGHVTRVPYLCLSLGLDRQVIRQLLAGGASCACSGVFSQDGAADMADPGMVAAFSRLVALAGQPEQVSFLAPVIIKEIHYRLLVGPLGKKVRAISSRNAKNCSCGYLPDRAPAWFFRRS